MIPARELAAYVSLAAVLAFILSFGTHDGYSKRMWVHWDVEGDGAGLGRPGGSSLASEAAFDVMKLPDVGRYRMLRTLNQDEFPLDYPNHRVILVGDIHGMYKPFNQLLSKLDYNPTTDVLIHTGDFLAKGLHHHSMATLDYMTRNNVTGVRGNHDQQILSWREWINWICSSREGRNWLKRTEHHWKVLHRGSKSLPSHPSDMDLNEDLDDFVEDLKEKASTKDRKWWKLIPAGWKFLSGQYRIAREMSVQQHEYLLQLPLALYVPHAHTFVVHAGILPSDPRYPYYDAKRQPLARIPDIFQFSEEDPLCHGDQLRCTNDLRRAQEMAILTDVPQNKVPWMLMNMRGVKNGKVFRKYKGVYWAKMWDRQMRQCVGFDNKLALRSQSLSHTTDDDNSDGNDHGSGIDDEGTNKKKQKNVPLPCYPAAVVYGHSASRGLSLKRWSMGLDSGCVYGRKLTALVLGGPQRRGGQVVDVYEDDGENADDVDDMVDTDETDDEDEIDSRSGYPTNTNRWRGRKQKKHGDGDIVPFGVHNKAKIVSVKCHEP